jgi:exopolysaccharide production protein ExoZ
MVYAILAGSTRQMPSVMQRLEAAFELGGSGRLLPMEGIRGIAVGLVFLQHYGMQFVSTSDVSGATWHIAKFFSGAGNRGVELFFVLSGYLIYKILLTRDPKFSSFVARRAQRLYPAFLVALLIGIALDPFRSSPAIPSDFVGAVLYLAANAAFLPGLFPIEALFAVNWSLSYEWWFYISAILIVGTLGFKTLPAKVRIVCVFALAAALVILSALGFEGAPVRGLCLFAGILLVEFERLPLKAPGQMIGVAAPLLALLASEILRLPSWATAAVLFFGFLTFVWAALAGGRTTDAFLCNRWLRWFGNMSYSYYLVHAFAVVITCHVVLPRLPEGWANLAFWVGLAPVFFVSVVGGALLYLFVEKPVSLQNKFSFRLKRAA